MCTQQLVYMHAVCVHCRHILTLWSRAVPKPWGVLDSGGRCPWHGGRGPDMVGGAPDMVGGGAPDMVGGAPGMVGGGPDMVGGAPDMVGGALTWWEGP